MKTKVALLSLMMTAAGLLFQPATAAAAEFGRDQHVRIEQRNDARFVREYREPIAHREDNRRGRDKHHRSEDRRDVLREGFHR
jgi:hypothetical protein